jgi:cytoskeletal protein CcmA (bactofilin family)
MSLNNMMVIKTVPSLISKNVSVEGNIFEGGIIEVEGKIKGNVEANTLTVRETGEILGEIKCKIFNIKGLFNGGVIAEKINISDTAKVSGVLQYKFLSVDYGASVNCQLKRTDDQKGTNGTSITAPFPDTLVGKEIASAELKKNKQ